MAYSLEQVERIIDKDHIRLSILVVHSNLVYMEANFLILCLADSLNKVEANVK